MGNPFTHLLFDLTIHFGKPCQAKPMRMLEQWSAGPEKSEAHYSSIPSLQYSGD
jgi:hypothetical protein